jgi:ankyrin repeat protein
MPQLLKCLCRNNDPGCETCAQQAREQWNAFAMQYPQATPGQLMEKAIEQGCNEVVLGILQNTGIDINEPCDPQRHGGVSPMMTALRAGNVRVVALIAGQPGFNLTKSLPAYERWDWVRDASLEVLRQYMAIPGSDVNQADGNGTTLLHEVVYDLDSQDKLQELLSQPDILVDAKQIDGTSPLYRAVLAGNVAAFRQLLAHGADVNNRNNDNRWTVLICAVAYDHFAIAEEALRSPDIGINAADDVEDTALHIACGRGLTRMVELLLKHPNIQINLRNHVGWTPLSKAAFAGHVEVVRLLLARPELEVNSVDQDRQTALFHAASNGSLDVVRLLLEDTRIDTAITNRPAGLTARDMAKALGFTAIAELIGQHENLTDGLSAES